MNFDPRERFVIVGVAYELDADPCTPRLWRIDGDQRVELATFGPGWDPHEVLRVATDDRVELESAKHRHSA